MGETHVPFDLFEEFLRGKEPRFRYVTLNLIQSFQVYFHLNVCRPECYNLLKHNCNNFSNEVVQFLTGRPIPDHIINLPMEALNRYVCIIEVIVYLKSLHVVLAHSVNSFCHSYKPYLDQINLWSIKHQLDNLQLRRILVLPRWKSQKEQVQMWIMG